MMLSEKLSYYRLNETEYKMMCDLLGREPQGVEWALFSALWSEHCSYKSSRVHLKKFFSESPRLLQGFGENAGVIDLGEGESVAFKMESHNHPSFIEPYQGAATGVGGILRDIFTMGARPVALGNYLCFGNPDADRMSELVKGVVAGISGYGNCVGVPNITGQTEFHESYDENILVNAFALGYFGKEDTLVTSQASGEGNYVVYVGAKTGRDGIHGASMASESFEEGSESKRPTIQIGDPFYEKLLIESCIEVIHQNLVVAIQDMGAAGLTSSSFEMASKGGVGFDLYLDQVPLRDSSMTPEDILLSESQERMLLICEPAQLEAIQDVFKKWNLDATVIGKVIKEKTIRLHWHGEVLTDIDPDLLTENAPQYKRDYDSNWVTEFKEDVETPSFGTYLENLFMTPASAPKNWIYDQYDQRVGAKTARDCGSSVGVIVLPESGRSLGIVLGCRPYMMRASAYLGAQDAIYYPAIELALKGMEPLAVTDCLNFGNPEKKNVMTDFVASVEGMSAACESIQAPVISGNVSFYNETRGSNITPTPSTGLVGLGLKPDDLPFDQFQKEGDLIYKVSLKNALEVSGKINEILGGPAKLNGKLNTQNVSAFIKGLTEVTRSVLPVATRIVGAFGSFYTLFKMSTEDLGFEIQKSPQEMLAEKLYEVIYVIDSKKKEDFEKSLNSLSDVMTYEKLGSVQNSAKMSFIYDNQKESYLVEDFQNLSQQAWQEAFPELSFS